MGEITTPGCLAGSNGAATDSATGCGAGWLTARTGAGAAATTALRATRTRWPFCSISISVRPVSSRSLVSSWMSLWSTSEVFGDFAIGSAFFFRAEQAGEPGDRQRIAVDAEAADHRLRRLRHVGILPEAFALVDIGEVDFDHRQLHRQQRVENGDRGGGVAGRIDHQARRLVGVRFLDPADQLAFHIRLPEYQFEAEALGGGAAQFFHVGERGAAVRVRLARAEQVHVGAVEDIDRLS